MALHIPHAVAARFVIALSLWSTHTPAAIHSYGASLTASDWKAVTSARECHLTHAIPAFGKATFTRRLGGELGFVVRADRGAHTAEAAVRVVPPSWKQGAEIRELGKIKVMGGSTPFRAEPQMSRQLLAELERGMVPTLYYREHAHGDHDVAVALSAVNFRPAYAQFQICTQALLPYGYADIRTTTVQFESDSTWLGYPARDALDRIVDYLRVEPDFKKVIVSGYTDNVGNRRYNDALSRQRAEAVKAYLVNAGLAPAKIETRGYGRRNPLAENATETGRATNRRALIRIKR